MDNQGQHAPVVTAVIGTAGHIDHGKSSLVEQLTGIHPSRLKEEQDRGMTIDIGYAEYQVSDGVVAGIIDVPGHERFIRNMVAGSAGVDMALLVVAADDGVMPQTREHLQIMRLLGIEQGVTVITKIDMVEDDLLELVADDIETHLEGTFLEGRPIVRVSNTTGEGIDELRAVLEGEINGIATRETAGVFRMPIQRSFTVKGHGTVVTGVPVSGAVETGDELEILPRGEVVRVRGIQVHHADAGMARAGHRTALNVTDVNYRDVSRGDVIAASGYFNSANLLEARFEYLDHFESPLRNNTAVRFHMGTADVGGSIVVLDRKVILPGESALVQVRLDQPIVAAPGDRFVARLASPMYTLGGGVVIGETRWKFKRFKDWLTDNLRQKEEYIGDRLGYMEYVVRSQGTRLVTEQELSLAMKLDVSELRDDLENLVSERKLHRHLNGRHYIHADMRERAETEVGEALLRLHEEEKLSAGFHANQIAKESRLGMEIVEVVVEEMVSRNRFERLSDRKVRHNKYTGGLSKEDMRLFRRIDELHREELFASPILSVIVDDLGKPKKKVRELLAYMTQMGQLVQLSEDLSVHRDAAIMAERLLVERILSGGPMESKEFKDIIGASRKYVIPLLEYFDKKGVTKRRDNLRDLTPQWEKHAFESTLEAPGEED